MERKDYQEILEPRISRSTRIRLFGSLFFIRVICAIRGCLVLFYAGLVVLSGCSQGPPRIGVEPAAGAQKVTGAKPEAQADQPKIETMAVAETWNPDPEPNEDQRQPIFSRGDAGTQRVEMGGQDWGSVSEMPSPPLNHRQDAEATQPHGQDARATPDKPLEEATLSTPLPLTANQGQVMQAMVEATPGSPGDAILRSGIGKTANREIGGPRAGPGGPVLANGEDVLQLDLPERLEMVQLPDLAAEYLNLDYLCDLEKIRGQWVSLRLHGKPKEFRFRPRPRETG